jgi:hypothetical protein
MPHPPADCKRFSVCQAEIICIYIALSVKDLRGNRKIPLAIRKLLAYITGMRIKVTKAVRDYMASIGRVGGNATGPRKARTTEQARAAVTARWAKVNAAKKAKQI